MASRGVVTCMRCGGFIVSGQRGPLPTFCSVACRVAAHRERRRADASPGGGRTAGARRRTKRTDIEARAVELFGRALSEL